ncbi:MAG: hypothetical protein Q8S84_02340 [bacterium]|nr:hypothetical protein [bacterium]MDP3380391.1 hypothetical protein [bacterium]
MYKYSRVVSIEFVLQRANPNICSCRLLGFFAFIIKVAGKYSSILFLNSSIFIDFSISSFRLFISILE